MATSTADGIYKYNDLIKSSNGVIKSLIDHAWSMNKYIEEKNGWPTVKRHTRSRGQWGVDINVSRIGHAIQVTNANSSIEEIAAAVHDGWKICYKYWSANRPWKSNNNNKLSLYIAPGKNISSRNKSTRANLNYVDLDDYQKNIYRQMATYIKNNCM